MVNQWALALPALVIAVFVASWIFHSTDEEATPVAHTSMIRSLSRYRFLLIRLRFALLGMVALVALAVTAASVLLARPIEETERNEHLESRDIVLCLDVSGSVIGYDAQVLETFSELVESFDGERVSLVIWNATSRVVFPLTDDYEMVQEQFTFGAEALATTGNDYETAEPVDYLAYLDFTAGTWADVGGASLVGDGLVTCAQQFDAEDDDRSRIIIFATDNDPSPKTAQIYQLEEAVDYVADRDIMLHGMFIDIGAWAGPGTADEFEEQISRIGGNVMFADDPEAAGQFTASIEEAQEAEYEAETEVVRSERPGVWPLLAAVGVSLLIVIGWRVKL